MYFSSSLESLASRIGSGPERSVFLNSIPCYSSVPLLQWAGDIVFLCCLYIHPPNINLICPKCIEKITSDLLLTCTWTQGWAAHIFIWPEVKVTGTSALSESCESNISGRTRRKSDCSANVHLEFNNRPQKWNAWLVQIVSWWHLISKSLKVSLTVKS